MKTKLFLVAILISVAILTSCEKDPVTPNDNPNGQTDNYTQKHVKNILLEDFTGAWCGYCPRVADAIDLALHTSTKIAAVAIHYNDVMAFSNVYSLMNAYGIEGFPTGLIDRNYKWPYPESTSGLSNAFNTKAPLGLKLNTSITDNTASIGVFVEFAADITYKTYITVFLIEDNIIASQVNYYNDGRGNPIANYVHKHVLRKAATSLFGNEIPSAQTVKDNIATFNYTMSLTGYNADNCNIVAFVTKSNGEYVQNVQFVKLGENKDFQIITK